MESFQQFLMSMLHVKVMITFYCVIMTGWLYSRLNNDKWNALKRTTMTKKKAYFRKSLFFSSVEISGASLRVRISPNLSKPSLHQQMDGVNCIFPIFFFFLWRIIMIILWLFLFLRRWCCTHLLLYFKFLYLVHTKLKFPQMSEWVNDDWIDQTIP